MRCLVSVQSAQASSGPFLGWSALVVTTLFPGLVGAEAGEEKPDATEHTAYVRSAENNGGPQGASPTRKATAGTRPSPVLAVEKGLVAAAISSATDTARPAASLSAHTAALLAVTRPSYEPPKNFAAAETFGAENEPAGDDVLYLPRLLVRGFRLPEAREVMSTNGMMEQYLGPKSGLDRGRLNFYTLYWGSGFIRVTLFAAVKNESRARDAFAAEERKRTNAQLRGMLRWGDASGLKHEIEKVLAEQKPLAGK